MYSLGSHVGRGGFQVLSASQVTTLLPFNTWPGLHSKVTVSLYVCLVPKPDTFFPFFTSGFSHLTTGSEDQTTRIFITRGKSRAVTPEALGEKVTKKAAVLRGWSPAGCERSVNTDGIKKLHTESFRCHLQDALGTGREREASRGAEESITPSPVSAHHLGDRCIKLSGNHFRLKSTFPCSAAHQESTERERDEEQSPKNAEIKKAFTFAFRGWPAPYSIEVIIRRTVNCIISNKTKTLVTAVSCNHAVDEVIVPIHNLPILDPRRG